MVATEVAGVRAEAGEAREPAERRGVGAAPATFYNIAGGGNDVYWRCTGPARAIGARVEMLPAAAAAVLLMNDHDFAPFRWLPDDDLVATYPDHQGVAVWTRPCLNRAVHATCMRLQGIRVLAEVDDNYLSDPSLNIFMRINAYDRKAAVQHLKAMCMHDGIVFSTGWLRDWYHRTIRQWLGKQHVPEMHVCHNAIAAADWPTPVPPRSDGRLRIGWMGSAQHVRDVKIAYPALRWAHEQGHQVVMVGHDFGDPDGVTDAKARAWCDAWRAIIDVQVPWRRPEEYRRAALPLDIGLAPLERNVHTLGKSAVKGVEYLVSGACFVASNVEVYRADFTHNETCLMAGSDMEMLYAVQQLVKSPALRERLTVAGQEYVRAERGDDCLRREWLAALSA